MADTLIELQTDDNDDLFGFIPRRFGYVKPPVVKKKKQQAYKPKIDKCQYDDLQQQLSDQLIIVRDSELEAKLCQQENADLLDQISLLKLQMEEFQKSEKEGECDDSQYLSLQEKIRQLLTRLQKNQEDLNSINTSLATQQREKQELELTIQRLTESSRDKIVDLEKQLQDLQFSNQNDIQQLIEELQQAKENEGESRNAAERLRNRLQDEQEKKIETAKTPDQKKEIQSQFNQMLLSLQTIFDLDECTILRATVEDKKKEFRELQNKLARLEGLLKRGDI